MLPSSSMLKQWKTNAKILSHRKIISLKSTQAKKQSRICNRLIRLKATVS